MTRRLLLCLVSALATAAFAQAPPPPPPPSASAPAPAPRAKPVALPPVLVPERSDAPVMTDGQFSPGEWDGATRVALNEAVELRLRQFRGVVFIGVRGSGADTMIGPSALPVRTGWSHPRAAPVAPAGRGGASGPGRGTPLSIRSHSRLDRQRGAAG